MYYGLVKNLDWFWINGSQRWQGYYPAMMKRKRTRIDILLYQYGGT